jgi:hypothetical protein
MGIGERCRQRVQEGQQVVGKLSSGVEAHLKLRQTVTRDDSLEAGAVRSASSLSSLS